VSLGFSNCLSYEAELSSEAMALAQRYGFVINNITYPRLHLTHDYLALLKDAQSKPIYPDFTCKINMPRYVNHDLVRACKPKAGMRIIDATAGLGRDALILARFGAAVLMLERNLKVYAMLEHALAHAQKLHGSLSLIFTDTKQYLAALKACDYPDVIYLDPMHPPRHNTALVKNNMQALQALIGPDADIVELLNLSRDIATMRTVLKWPKTAELPAGSKHVFSGKTINFAVY
jgi:16S rRNA (guanine1516-N2)-methyltransferase